MLRGTDRPFEQLGAPWIDGPRLALMLNELGLPGLRFVPIRFRPESSRFAGTDCGGVQIVVTDRSRVRPVRMGLELASALLRLHPKEFDPKNLGNLLNHAESLRRLMSGDSPAHIEQSWKRDLEVFRTRRAPFLLY